MASAAPVPQLASKQSPVPSIRAAYPRWVLLKSGSSSVCCVLTKAVKQRGVSFTADSLATSSSMSRRASLQYSSAHPSRLPSSLQSSSARVRMRCSSVSACKRHLTVLMDGSNLSLLAHSAVCEGNWADVPNDHTFVWTDPT